MDPQSVWLPGIKLGHMAEKLAFNEPLINMSASRQWIRRVSTAVAGYQSVVPISKYKGGWKLSARYLPYMPQKKVKYGHQPFVMPNNEVHG